MRKQLSTLLLVIFALILNLPRITSAQGESVAVPDLTGLSVPQAAALLNHDGLNLGVEKAVPWTEASGLPQNKVSGQSVAAGQQVAKASAIDVTVPRVTNIILLYDYNSFTLVNKTGLNLELGDLKLNSFAATTWKVSQIADGQCAQVWAVSRRGPENVPDCAKIQTWYFNTNKAIHFWRSAPGATQFSFIKGGVPYGICDAAPPDSKPMRCDIYLADSAQDDLSDYLYFAYSADQLIIHNISKDVWTPLSDVKLINNLPAAKGQTFAPGDINNYAVHVPVGRVDKLAPNQCIWFTNGNSALTEPPQACDVIAQLKIDPGLIFWASDFGVDGVLDTRSHICPKATPGKLTICVMPR
jgi:hypothetical protein